MSGYQGDPNICRIGCDRVAGTRKHPGHEARHASDGSYFVHDWQYSNYFGAWGVLHGKLKKTSLSFAVKSTIKSLAAKALGKHNSRRSPSSHTHIRTGASAYSRLACTGFLVVPLVWSSVQLYGQPVHSSLSLCGNSITKHQTPNSFAGAQPRSRSQRGR